MFEIEIVPESHVDHNIPADLLQWALGEIKAKVAAGEYKPELVGLVKITLDFPGTFAPVPCGLVGPITNYPPVPESDVCYLQRNRRKCVSRMIGNDSTLHTSFAPGVRTLSVIAGPDNGKPWVLYTAFGGPIAPGSPVTRTSRPGASCWSPGSSGPSTPCCRPSSQPRARVIEPGPFCIKLLEKVMPKLPHITTLAEADDLAQQLEARRKEIVNEGEVDPNLTTTENLANALHKRLCHQGHTDGCGFYYEPGFSGDEHQRWLYKAQRLLKATDFPSAMRALQSGAFD
jgi:hypothetical protein